MVKIHTTEETKKSNVIGKFLIKIFIQRNNVVFYITNNVVYTNIPHKNYLKAKKHDISNGGRRLQNKMD